MGNGRITKNELSNNFRLEIEDLQSTVGGNSSQLNEKANQTELDEVIQQVENLDLTDTSIEITDANNHFTSTTLDGVLDEVFTDVSNGKTLIKNAITDKDSEITIPTNPSFAQLQTAIGQIETGFLATPGSIEEYGGDGYTGGTTYKKVAEYKFKCYGNLSIIMEVRDFRQVWLYTQIYKNGVLLDSISTNYNEDVDWTWLKIIFPVTVNKGDVFELWCRHSNSEIGMDSNFGISHGSGAFVDIIGYNNRP